MEYFVIARESLEDLISASQNFIDSGWQLQGGIAATVTAYQNDNHKFCFMQAVVRTNPAPPLNVNFTEIFMKTPTK